MNYKNDIITTMNLLSRILSVLNDFGNDQFTEFYSLNAFQETSNDINIQCNNIWDGNIVKFNTYLKGIVCEIERNSDQSKYIKAYALAKWLDCKMTYNSKNYGGEKLSIWSLLGIAADDDYVQIGALNTNYEETGIWINPKFPIRKTYASDDSDREKRVFNRDAFYGLNGELNNFAYFVWDGTRRINNIIISGEALADAEDGKLSIAFAPMTSKQNILKKKYGSFTRKGYQKCGISISLGNFGKELYYRMLEDWKIAADNGADIIFMPEALGTESVDGTNEENDKFFYDLYRNRIEKGQHVPYITIWPSYWHDSENGATITYASGFVIGTQYKYYPFVSKRDNREEALREYDIKESMIIHIPFVHRVSVLICSEFLSDNESRWSDFLCRCFGVSLLIVPSYSYGGQDFINKVQGYVGYDTTVIWGNCCGAAYEANCCGACSIPGTNNIEMFKCDNGGSCDGVKACIFMTKLPLRQLVYRDAFKTEVEQIRA
ncbi:hypothetical protein [Butyrivibrio sp. INlla16]|uniref:hypothetical protein n=1 Tax=Butyrivibrio sp. INlla16 TaxID=1520807 RepID=UPI00088B07AA|nr:hypothetical protein [Butyrivibrio sp. INlla16]SDB68474.1 hypothetical protein SAMN02910263_04199 [Butyrivibrio sp. INlla16]